MERLTKHKDGTENAYTSPCKKQELVDRLGQYEDIASVEDLKKLVEQQEAAAVSRASSEKTERRIAPEERAEYERNTDPFPELRGAAQRQRSAAKKQQHPAQCNREAAQKQQHPEQRNREAVQKQQHPARTGSGTASYRARMAEDLPEKKRSRKAAAPADDMQIPGQMDIFQFLGGAV